MQSVSDLLNPVGTERRFWESLAEYIRDTPIAKWTFDDWDWLLNVAHANGLTAHDGDSERLGTFASPLAVALLARWRWGKQSRERGLTPQQAEREFNQRILAERKAFAELQEQQVRQRAADIAREAQARPNYSTPRKRGVMEAFE